MSERDNYSTIASDHLKASDPKPDWRQMVAGFVDVDPWHGWYVEGEHMGEECHFCDAVGSVGAREHEPGCLWLLARAALNAGVSR